MKPFATLISFCLIGLDQAEKLGGLGLSYSFAGYNFILGTARTIIPFVALRTGRAVRFGAHRADARRLSSFFGSEEHSTGVCQGP